jgi:hypothetical protein
VGQPDLVGGDQPHDLGKTQGHDRKIVLAQPRRRQHDDQPGRAGDDWRQHPAAQDRHVPGRCEQRRGIGAQREEAGEAEIDHAGAAPDQVEPERQQAVDAADGGDEEQVVQHR